MKTTRRGFLGSLLALAAAPAIVRADSLMKITPIDRLILWGDGVHDDAAALQALIDGRSVIRRDGSIFHRDQDGGIILTSGTFAVGSTIILPASRVHVADCRFTSIGRLDGCVLAYRR